MQDVKYIYHYTTIDALMQILKNRTIRFRKLTKTDDIEESKTGDIGEAGQYVFVSCWTESNEEILPMWHMYSKEMSGVRIGLPFLPFKDYSFEKIANQNIPEFSKIEANAKQYRDFTANEMIHNLKYTIVATFYHDSTINDLKVIYTEDENLIKPNVLTTRPNLTSIAFQNVGKYKRTYWSFQKEVRYRLLVLPITNIEIQNQLKSSNQGDTGSSRIIRQAKIDIDYFDMKIEDDYFEKMIITLGIALTPEQKSRILTAVEEFNPKALVTESILQNKYRLSK